MDREALTYKIPYIPQSLVFQIAAHFLFNALPEFHQLPGILFQGDILFAGGCPLRYWGRFTGIVYGYKNNNAVCGLDPTPGAWVTLHTSTARCILVVPV